MIERGEKKGEKCILILQMVKTRAGEPVGVGCFMLHGAGAAREKNQELEPEPLGKKSGAEAAKN